LVLTVNGGSSSVKFALYQPGDLDGSPRRVLGGQVERIGQTGTTLSAKRIDGTSDDARPISAADHEQAAGS